MATPHSTYGDAFADVYDDWYRDISDVDATVGRALAELAAGAALPVLELGVGTGRLAVPLAARGVDVVGIDASPAMLAGWPANDPTASVARVLGDMVDDLPDGPFALVFVAYNTCSTCSTDERQQACFAAVAAGWRRAARSSIEAFVPETAAPGRRSSVRSMTADSVVLSVTTHDADDQRARASSSSSARPAACGCGRGRSATPTAEQLDAMAPPPGFVVGQRWEDFAAHPFDARAVATSRDGVSHKSTCDRRPS